MEKLKYIKIEHQDGTLSENVPIGVDANNVDVGNENLSTKLNKLDANDTSYSNSITSLQSQISSLASGSPAGVYATVAALTSADPDHSKIYIVTADGHWYYYNSGWQDGGIYQGTTEGNKIEKIENDLDSMSNRIVSINHFFCTDYEDGYYWNLGGGKSVNADYMAVKDYMPVNPSTEYYSSLWNKTTGLIYGNLSVITTYYDSNKNFISGEQTYNFTTPNNCYYIRISPMKSTYNTYNILINQGHSANYYYAEYFSPYRVIKEEATPLINNEITNIKTKQDSLLTYKISKNICNITNYEDGHYWSAGTGALLDNENFIAVDDYFPVEGNSHYYMSLWNKTTENFSGAMNCIVCYYTEEKSFIIGEDVNNFTTPYNCAFIRISPHKPSLVTNNIMIEKGNAISDNYEPYYEPYSIIKLSALPDNVLNKTINYITVATDGSGDYTKIQTALESITDASENNEYIVNIKEGTYDLGADFTEAQLAADSGYAGITIPNYVYLKGQGDKTKIILSVRLNTKHQYISALNFARTSGIENLTIIGEKTRYAIHDDFGAGPDKPYYRTIKNCIIKGINNYYSVAYGSGTQPQAHWDFENTIFDGTEAGNNGVNAIPFTVHNSLKNYDSRIITFNNCRFLTNNSNGAVLLKSLNIRPNNTDEAHNYTYVTFNNCKFGTGSLGFKLVEENVSVYGSGCKYFVTGANNVNETYEIVVTDGQDYSSRVDLL